MLVAFNPKDVLGAQNLARDPELQKVFKQVVTTGSISDREHLLMRMAERFGSQQGFLAGGLLFASQLKQASALPGCSMGGRRQDDNFPSSGYVTREEKEALKVFGLNPEGAYTRKDIAAAYTVYSHKHRHPPRQLSLSAHAVQCTVLRPSAPMSHVRGVAVFMRINGKRLARITHPDRGGSDQAMSLLNVAKGVLLPRTDQTEDETPESDFERKDKRAAEAAREAAEYQAEQEATWERCKESRKKWDQEDQEQLIYRLFS